MRKFKTFQSIVIVLAMTLFLLSGCGTRADEPDTVLDAAADAAMNTESDSGTDTAKDAATDTSPDVATDVVTDAVTDTTADASTDAAADTVTDATSDTSPGASSDADDADAFTYSDAIDDNGYWKGVNALDYVELFDYRSLVIPEDVHEISDDDIQAEIDYMLTYYPSTKQISDRAVADGDTVNIDFVGSIDGIEFENGSTGGMGVDVTIGVTTYIDDFLEQLIGHMPGETVNVEVTFPDDYHEESLQGKDALFVTVINYIAEADTELSDEFVIANLYDVYGWTTVEELRSGIRSVMQKNAIHKYLQQYITSEATIRSVPDQLLEYQENAMLEYYQGYAEYSGMELEEFLSISEGLSGVDELIEANRESNMENAVYYLVTQAVAEDAGITPSREDLESFFLEFFETNDYSMYEEYYGLPYLMQMTLCQKVIDYIVDNAILG